MPGTSGVITPSGVCRRDPLADPMSSTHTAPATSRILAWVRERAREALSTAIKVAVGSLACGRLPTTASAGTVYDCPPRTARTICAEAAGPVTVG